MHEQSLMNSLMKNLETAAAAEGATRVTGVTVWLGALSHMSPQQFQEHFLETSRGTIAENAGIRCIESNDQDHPHAAQIILESIEVPDES